MKKTILLSILTLLLADSFGQTFQSLTICNEKNNFVYKGVSNTIKAFADDCPCELLILTTDNGILQSVGHCNYNWIPEKTENTSLILKKINNKDTILIGSAIYSVKNIPDPVIYLAGKKQGTINKSVLAGSTNLYGGFVEFDIDIYIKILSFKTIIIRDTTVIYCKDNIGKNFSKEFLDLAKTLEKDDLIIFTQTKIKMADIERTLRPFEFTIE